jgi:hypothetical protein
MQHDFHNIFALLINYQSLLIISAITNYKFINLSSFIPTFSIHFIYVNFLLFFLAIRVGCFIF